MSELISGKEAWIAKANKEDVQYRIIGMNWDDLTDREFINWETHRFLSENSTYEFRLKPCTITINGIEVEEPRGIIIVGDTSLSFHFDHESERNRFLNAINNVSF